MHGGGGEACMVVVGGGGHAWWWWWGYVWCWGDMWQGGHAWQEVCMAGGCAWQGEGACVAGGMATVADVTHPTGMHSCFDPVFRKF